MKVLQVLPTLSAGGAEGFVTNLGVSLTELGCETRFFLLAGVRGERGRILYQRLLRSGIEVVGTEERKIRSLTTLLHLADLIRSWKPDIVQANLYSCEVACALARVLSKRSGAHYVRRLANSDSYACSRRKFRMLDRFMHLSIACSPAVAATYADLMGTSDGVRLVTIPNGGQLLDSSPTRQEKAQARKSLGVPLGAFVVAHIGRMEAKGKGPLGGLDMEQKAHDVLLKSFAQAFEKDTTCLLLCVGDGDLRSTTEEFAESLGMNGTIRFLGEVAEPWPVLKAADVFCFPSRFEGLPNVLPEAASCGLPVVASDIPEIRSLSPGDAWLLEPVDDVPAFADALRTIRTRRDWFSSEAGMAAKSFRERFSMSICAQKYIDAFATLLAPAEQVEHTLPKAVRDK